MLNRKPKKNSERFYKTFIIGRCQQHLGFLLGKVLLYRRIANQYDVDGNCCTSCSLANHNNSIYMVFGYTLCLYASKLYITYIYNYAYIEYGSIDFGEIVSSQFVRIYLFRKILERLRVYFLFSADFVNMVKSKQIDLSS